VLFRSALRAGTAPVEGLGRLKQDGHAGVLAAHVVARHDPPSVGGVDDPDPGARGALEDHEVVEPPVQHGAARQVLEVAEVSLDPARPQPAGPGGAHQGQRGDAVPPGTGQVPQLAEVGPATEVAEHHGQAGRAAVGVLQLPDDRDPPAHGVLP
jgi:hypothetical protein